MEKKAVIQEGVTPDIEFEKSAEEGKADVKDEHPTTKLAKEAERKLIEAVKEKSCCSGKSSCRPEV